MNSCLGPVRWLVRHRIVTRLACISLFLGLVSRWRLDELAVDLTTARDLVDHQCEIGRGFDFIT